MARVQSQQQQVGNQQFGGLGGQSMGNMSGGGANGPQQPQSQPFHDNNSNQPQQSSMPASFPPGGLANAAAMQQRGMLFPAGQAGHNNPNVSRQLEMLIASQNQQPQNNPINLNQRLDHQRQQQHAQQQHQQQMQAMNHSSPGDIFPNAMVDRRPSPAHPNIQGPNPIGGGPAPQQQQRARFTFAELATRATSLRDIIRHQEQLLTQLNTQRPLSPDANYIDKMRTLSNEIKLKKEYLAKMSHAIQAMGYAYPSPFMLSLIGTTMNAYL